VAGRSIQEGIGTALAGHGEDFQDAAGSCLQQ